VDRFADAPVRGRLVTLLSEIAATGVWTNLRSGGGSLEAASAYFVARLANELRELDGLVRRAHERLTLDGAALEATATGIRRQAAAVESARSAAEALEAASATVAQHAAELSVIYERLPAVTATSIETVGTLDARTRAAADAFGQEAGVIAKLDADWKRVADAVHGIAASGRRARILAVNAAIEAASVEGGGFGIVTDRMRALSAATLTAASDVDVIVRRNAASMRKAAADIGQARAAMDALLGELRAARASFETATVNATAFGDGVSQVAAIADEQAAALPQIANAVAGLAELARSIAAAAAEDAHAAVAASLADATRALARRRGFDAVAPLDRPDTGGDALATWLCELAEGGDAPPPAGLGPDESALVEAANALLAQTLDAERVIVRGLCDAAGATARTGMVWRSIIQDVRAFDAQVSQLSAALAQAVEGAGSLAATSRRIAADLTALEALCSAALAAFDRALDAVDAGHALGADVLASIAAMESATTEAEALLVQIGDVSEDAGLLAVNAAVEAARAGDRGLAFTVIADEIGRLATSTQRETDGVVRTILSLRALSGELQAGSERQDAEMSDVQRIARSARATVDETRTAIAASVERGASVGETSARVAMSLGAVAGEVAAVRELAASASAPEVTAARIALARLGDEALHVTERRALGLPEERLREATRTLAREAETALQACVDAGRVRVDEMTSTDYRELRGALVDRLAPFFDVSDAPRDGFKPPKWCTPWDDRVDRALVEVLDAWMESYRGIILASVFDLNGFALAFPTKLDGVRRADGRIDWRRWGGKAIYTDYQTLHGSRVALHATVDQLPERMTRAEMIALGCDLAERTPRPWGLRTTILRGTREVSRGASAPVYVGGIRIATVVLMERGSGESG
jgi:methyl-accepting chemotaxis protein